jgi:hypothetical protein
MLPPPIRSSESPYGGPMPTSRMRSVSTPDYHHHSVTGSPTQATASKTSLNHQVGRRSGTAKPFTPSMGTNAPVGQERSRPPSPYYNLNLSEIDNLEDPIMNSPEAAGLTRSAIHHSSSLVASTGHSSSAFNPSTTNVTSPSSGMARASQYSSPRASNVKTIYGTNTSTRSLVDEDPPVAANATDHFNLRSSSTASFPSATGGRDGGVATWPAGPAGPPPSSGSGPSATAPISHLPRLNHIQPSLSDGGGSIGNNDNNTSIRRLDSSRRRREERAVQRRQHRSMRSGGSESSADSLVMSTSEHSGYAAQGGRTMELSAAPDSPARTMSQAVMTSAQPLLPPSAPSSSLLAVGNRIDNNSSSMGDAYLHNSMPRGQLSYGDGNERGGEGTARDGVVPVPGRASIHQQQSADLICSAKKNSKALLAASKSNEIDKVNVRKLLECCREEQGKLQLRLSTALEETDPVDNLEELFGLNDSICSAIEAGKNALKREKERAKKKKIMDGPTIDLLVENEDVFSLICMLRAPDEKRLQSALALMKFAKEDEVLRNEIRSSGGMHSFLTLFRTKGMTQELQVVASLAVAYVLPSFVASSQTSPSVGLKIVECLRFLVISSPVSPNGLVITREEMCTAASMGVNVLWINAIQPLITMEQVKNQAGTARPSFRRGQSVKFGRLRSKTGGEIFDQGQESIEIQELTELAVTLIAHLAKLAQSRQLNIDIGYHIVEQVCEVDEARPIAVREGLLAIFVEWIQSGNVDKIRPAASALRYLISIKDKYMAGWIHSQVVNEGAVKEIVKLLNESVGHDVRVAVAQMLSTLCVAPHTRAAVVEANCVSYLVALLYEHSASDSEEMVFCAGSALLQLAAGAMTSASEVIGDTLGLGDSDNNAKHENVVKYVGFACVKFLSSGWCLSLVRHNCYLHILNFSLVVQTIVKSSRAGRMVPSFRLHSITAVNYARSLWRPFEYSAKTRTLSVKLVFNFVMPVQRRPLVSQ